MKSGVPQGSVLGPLLFILFINDLPNTIKSSKILTFADDTKLVHQISSSIDTTSLQTDLNSIITWSANNNMQLNKDKFELVSHRQIKNSSSITFLQELPFYNLYNEYSTGDAYISPTNCVRDLGVMINNKLDWGDHISKICKLGRQLSGWIINVFFSRDKLVLLTLFNSIIRSRLEYCCQLWSPCKITQINDIEQIQRSFTSKIKSVRDLNYLERLSAKGQRSNQNFLQIKNYVASEKARKINNIVCVEN